MAAEEHWNKLKPWFSGREQSDGEQRMYCPLCEDPTTSNSPSASANRTTGLWKCFSCNNGGGIPKLVRSIAHGERQIKSDKGSAKYDPFPWYDGDNMADVSDLDEHRERKAGNGHVERISEAKVLGYVEKLKSLPERMAYLLDDRGLTKSTLEKFKVGYDAGRDRYTFPVYDEEGNLVNIRRYLPGADKGNKMRNAQGHGSPPRLYPMQVLEGEDEAWIIEGEIDALLNNQNGFPTVTGTHGANTWEPSWSDFFTGKKTFLCYDNDKEGRVGMRKAGRMLLRTAAEVWLVAVPVEEEHGDLADYWVTGGTVADLKRAARQAERVVPRTEQAEASSAPMPVPVQVVGSMDSSTNGKPLEMQVTITGKRNPTYSVPYKALLECTLDAGPKCKTCPMFNEHEGEVEVTIPRTDVATLSKFIDASDTQTLEHLRKYIGAVKCNRFERTEVENQTIEELFVTGSIDYRTDHEEADYTQRRIYNVGGHDTKTNTVAAVVGTTIPNHKDRRNEFFSWDLKPAVTSIDKFEMTTELRKELLIFQPKKGQTPIERCRDIAKDLSDNVTGILGRERLHMCMDLVWHSILHFTLDDKIISRGWLEFLSVGDTRTGKSETAIRLSNHYGLGHVIGCEGATFAGLVGAVKKVGNNDAWTIQWGEITINDRRLVVLDEASGLSTDIISQMSDIRSRGMAQLTKAETAQTRARCRLIWISNPRKGKFIDEKKYEGIDIIEDLIGNPEDIARFDFAMSVSQDDVPNERINRPERRKVKHEFTSDACRDLILWAWSRRPEQVIWDEDAYRGIYKAAEWLGKRYVDSPPLIQRTNVREKIARIAVALAARTFSTDETGELVCVKLDHVKGAMYFLDELYSYDNFGYFRLSQRSQRNRRIAKRNRDAIRKWLESNPRLLDFLINRRGSFRAQDLEEMAHMQREEANHVLGKLTEARMISKSKSQILLEPELHSLLREMEKK